MTHRVPRLLLLVFLAVVLAVSIFPFLFAFSTSLRPRAELFQFPPRWLPDTWAWSNYVDVWSAVSLTKFVGNSLVVSLLATILNVTLAGRGRSDSCC
jgi:multiple sugar transport system permease protein